MYKVCNERRQAGIIDDTHLTYKSKGIKKKIVSRSNVYESAKKEKLGEGEFEFLTFLMLKFIYSEKATNFCEIFTLLLSYICSANQK